jgi:hypothetical protein
MTAAGCGRFSDDQPQVLHPSKIAEAVASIPKYTELGFSGLASHSGKVYATSNIGILEIQDGRIIALYRWHPKDPVVEGPWPNLNDGSLLFHDPPGERFLSCKSGEWSTLPLPNTQLSRKDMLLGFRGYSNRSEFWMVCGRNLWSLVNSRWVDCPSPPAREAIAALIPFKDTLVAVSRNEPFTEWEKSLESNERFDAIYKFANAAWAELLVDGFRFHAKDVVSSESRAFILTRTGEILELSSDLKLSRLQVPGPSEAICVTSKGFLVSSVPGLGIYEYDKDWVRICRYPFGPDEGKHEAFVTEAAGAVILATNSITRLDKPSTGTTSLWFSKDSHLEKIAVGDPK